jgi:hypothetical protein
MRWLTLLVLSGVALAGCEIDGLTVTQYWDPDAGEAMESDVQDLMQADDPPQLEVKVDGEWPDPFVGELGPVHWGSGAFGGATASFVGTGDEICAIVDPQSVFRDDWVMSGSGETSDASMDNYIDDDGDIDLMLGMSADYTGTPGEIMGSFKRTFVDPLGVEREADFNLCIMYDMYGLAGGSAGRATPEWCTVETVEGVQYTVVLQTFSVPLDDDLLRFVLQVREGACPASVDECTLRGDADPDPVEVVVGNNTFDYDDLEQRYCDPRHL